jgi:hypothetical protein
MRACLSIALLISMFLLPAVFVGCEESHSESTKQGLFGGTKHEETTVYKNPVTGDTAVEHSQQVTH